jgi:hypothetical protein
MSVKAFGFVYYGIALHGNTVRALEKRDEKRKKKCAKCGQELTSKFCPDDGSEVIQVDVAPGFSVLRSFHQYKIESVLESLTDAKEVALYRLPVRSDYSDMGSDSGHYLYIGETRIRTIDQYQGRGDDHVKLDTMLAGAEKNRKFYNSCLFQVCEYLQIPYEDPHFYVGIEWNW